jgi:hypothetical protein
VLGLGWERNCSRLSEVFFLFLQIGLSKHYRTFSISSQHVRTCRAYIGNDQLQELPYHLRIIATYTSLLGNRVRDWSETSTLENVSLVTSGILLVIIWNDMSK